MNNNDSSSDERLCEWCSKPMDHPRRSICRDCRFGAINETVRQRKRKTPRPASYDYSKIKEPL